MIFESPDIVAVFKYLVWDINQFVPQQARDFLFLHAGSVARDDGGLLLPAPPDRGKSTLVAALLKLGYGYLSDELGLIDPVTSRLYPFPRRISLDESALRFFPGLEQRLDDRVTATWDPLQRHVRPEDLEAVVAGPSVIRRVVFLGEDRRGRPKLSPISRAEAVERMAANCFNLYRYGDRGVIVLSRVAAEAEAYELEGGSVLERADLLAHGQASR